MYIYITKRRSALLHYESPFFLLREERRSSASPRKIHGAVAIAITAIIVLERHVLGQNPSDLIAHVLLGSLVMPGTET